LFKKVNFFLFYIFAYYLYCTVRTIDHSWLNFFFFLIKSRFFILDSTNHLIHDLNNPLSGSLDKNTSGISNSSSNGTGSGSTSAPQYAEIYASSTTPAQQQQNQQSYQSTNPYATTGLFVNQPNGVTAALIKNAIINNSANGNHNCNLNVQNITDNPYNVLTYQTSNNTRAIAMPLQTVMTDSNGKYSSYTIKIINDKICVGNDSNNACNQHQPVQSSLDEVTLNTLSTLNALSTLSNSLSMCDQKKLLNYLQATQSQTNTPRVMVKNLNNKVKSCEGGQQQQYLNEPVTENLININTASQFASPQLSRQLVNYLSSTNGADCKNAVNISNNPTNVNSNTKNILVDMILQQQQQQQQQQQSVNSSSTPIPSLPAAPPPSLATALFAHQQYHPHHHHQQQQHNMQQQSQQIICNHFARPEQSPVHYNSPWNVNIDPALASTNNNNTNLNSAIVLNRVNPNQTSSTKMLNMANASGGALNNSTLPRNTHLVPSVNSSFQPIPFSPQHHHHQHQQQQQTSFTRHIVNGKPQYKDSNYSGSPQQDYSSISPEDELNEVEMKLSEFYHVQQHQQMQQNPVQRVNQILKSADSLNNNNTNTSININKNNTNNNSNSNNNNSNVMQHSWTSGTESASNPMSGSYDSRNQTSSSSDRSNSSELSSKHSSNSEDALSTHHHSQQLQEKLNNMTTGLTSDVDSKHLVKRNQKQLDKEIKNKQMPVNSSGYQTIGHQANDELYISEMLPQTIL
jgi:hypothetical protein